MLNWVEVSKSALIHNVKQFRRLIGPRRKLLLVVKANAYGHGLTEISKIVVRADKSIWLGVNSIDEGLVLRKNGVKTPVLVLGYAPLNRLKEAARANLRLMVYNRETIESLGRLRKKIIVHLKVETGTGRQGVLEKDVLTFVRLIQKYSHIKLEGLATHFANIEDTTRHNYACQQIKKFEAIGSCLEEEGVCLPLKHTACSAAALLFPETYFDLVRVGIGLYGLWPSKKIMSAAKKARGKIILKPVLTWKTRLAQIKDLPAGSYISYGCTEKLRRDSKVAVLPVGYSDGYDRKLSKIGYVLIKGRRAKVLGRVCMNMIVVDISKIKSVRLEDEVVLLGKQGREEITAEEIAEKIGTINYEVVSRINPLLPRIIK